MSEIVTMKLQFERQEDISELPETLRLIRLNREKMQLRINKFKKRGSSS